MNLILFRRESQSGELARSNQQANTPESPQQTCYSQQLHPQPCQPTYGSCVLSVCAESDLESKHHSCPQLLGIEPLLNDARSYCHLEWLRHDIWLLVRFCFLVLSVCQSVYTVLAGSAVCNWTEPVVHNLWCALWVLPPPMLPTASSEHSTVGVMIPQTLGKGRLRSHARNWASPCSAQ